MAVDKCRDAQKLEFHVSGMIFSPEIEKLPATKIEKFYD